MVNPVVSVIIPTHNMAQFVGSAIDSVLQQTWSSLEIIVVDDCSSDDTVEVVKSIQDSRIHLFCQDQNRGPSAARNRGIRAAQGEYIAFLDADDIWLSTKLAKQIALFERDPKIGLVSCGSHVVDSELRLLRTPSVGEPWPPAGDKAFERIARRQHIITTFSTMVVRKACFEDVGIFDESIFQAEEWDLYFRLAYRWGIQFVCEPLVLYRMTGHFVPGKRLQRKIDEAHSLTLERAFARLGDPPQWDLLRRQLQIQEMWLAALHYFAVDNPERAREAITQITSQMPDCLDFDNVDVMNLTAYTAWGLYDTVTPLDDVARFIDRVFAHLPDSVHVSRQTYQKTLALAFAICAFDSSPRGEVQRVSAAIAQAIRHDPSWSTNRGLWKQLFYAWQRRFASTGLKAELQSNGSMHQ